MANNHRQLKSSLFGSASEKDTSSKPTTGYRDRSVNEQDEDLQDSEFNQVALELGQTSQALKHIAGELKDEVSQQVYGLKGTSTNMTETNVGMKKVMTRMEQVFDVRTWSQMWTLVLIIVGVFFFFYYLIRFLVYYFK
ncbi:predicted protein [Naegleria gruberi]|uniref:Predicted protein n=1 Tax=Naegleria gruberi TaxID=5762 RepID=D2UYB2_NAEGR|nr:uncharacterized protein NAEGRDRAFT_61410 [Naegleria gruberi]EFC50444.1 predicted protein [Naegleria gruberi]|eukprot:XP_002683188.1 predicted protein [Naegleria gruberi strain NEG-M]